MKEKKIPLRKCVGCNEMKQKQQLVRIVKNNASEISVDITGKMPGRGAYICKNTDCLKIAIKRKSLERAFKGKIDALIYEMLEGQIGG